MGLQKNKFVRVIDQVLYHPGHDVAQFRVVLELIQLQKDMIGNINTVLIAVAQLENGIRVLK